MSQRWLVQVNSDSVEWINRPADRGDFHPAVDRKGQEPPAEGDLVVLWEMGTAAAGGAVALGYFTGPLVPLEHPVSWGNEDGPRTARLSRRIEFTHLFEGPDKITRPELKADPRFEGWSFFQPMGARGANPYPLSMERYDAIVERVPAWADLAAAQAVLYDVTLSTAVAPDVTPAEAVVALREALGDDSDALVVEVSRSDGQPRGEVDFLTVVEPYLVEDDTVVSWSTQQQGRTAMEAYLEVIALNDSNEGLISEQEGVVINAGVLWSE